MTGPYAETSDLEPEPPRRTRKRQGSAPTGDRVTVSETIETPAEGPASSDFTSKAESLALPSEPIGGTALTTAADPQKGVEEAEALRDYARHREIVDTNLGLALRSYADRIESVARGESPTGAAGDLSPVTPTMIAEALTRSSQLIGLELLRNVLIFLPVLWTWYEVSRAARAYGQLDPASRSMPFIALWQEGLGDAHSLSTTAIVAVGLLTALVVISLLLSIQRARVDGKRDFITADVASLISRAAAVQPAVNAATPTAQIDAFIAAGQGLVASLRDVAERMRLSAEPLAASVAHANEVLRTQSEQMQRQIMVIERIAPSLERLGTAAPSFESAAATLRAIEESLTPSAASLVDAVEELGDYSGKLSRATDDFTAGLASVNQGTDQFTAATKTMNEVANRLMDGIERRER